MGKKSKSAPTEPSLSGFLLGQVDSKDLQLDDIFANSKGPSVAFQEPKKEKKGKKDKKSKRAASPVVEAPAAVVDEPEAAEEEAEEEDEDEEMVDNDAELSEIDSDASLGLPSDDDDDDGVEEAYTAKLVAARLKALAAGGKKRKAETQSDEEDEEAEEVGAEESGDSDEEEEELLDIEHLMRSTILPKAIYKEVPATVKEAKEAGKAKKKAHAEETPEQRDARTIFIGNVPVECSTSRPMKKALIRHVLSSPAVVDLLPSGCPPLKCDSIRFRSLAFASTVFGRKATATDPESGETVTVEAGGRGRKRAREWRDTESTDERGVMGGYRQKEKEPEKPAPTDNRKGALTDGQKRRVAFIRGELNEGKKACNAYLVLEALPASFSALSDADILKILVDCTDGSTFEGNMLRADHVRPRSSAALLAAAQMAAKPNAKITVPEQGPSYTVPAVEARRTIFIGGLDFAESEENVRVAVEAALVREKGPSGEKGWVEGVRIIRDASSGLGKGFGYVLLRDDACVDELLALPAGKYLKVSKRKVRLERCKTGIAAARAKAAAASKDAKNSAPAKLAAPRDPSLKKHGAAATSSSSRGPAARPSTSASEHQAKLAEALAKLPPTERKAIKAIDPERLQRRAMKKKNKVLGERYERKMANQEKKGGVAGILGRESRGHARARQEKKRVAKGNKTGKRAKKSDL